ncbi:hypothetical protein BB561_006714 [Smittium simulii]|uniref:SCP domain-containing protein n=1 Tax=Smittium simulii TaxID=133385 RepID=A0A2T9Y253_9FUNG|nr:hypothetical protein BB561_006714 [Smittium simulii]
MKITSVVSSLLYVLSVAGAPVNMNKREVIYVTEFVTVVRDSPATATTEPTKENSPVTAQNYDNTVYVTEIASAQKPTQTAEAIRVVTIVADQTQTSAPEAAPRNVKVDLPKESDSNQNKQQEAPQAKSGDSYGSISDSEAQQILSLVNNLRSEKGLKSLKLDSGLTAAALAQSKYQAENNSMTHGNRNFSGLADRFSASGSSCSGGCAENIAGDFGSVSDVFKAWAESQGHLDNMLGSGSTSMGIAKSGGYWTQTFNGQ